MAIQKSRSQGADVTGEQLEQVLSEIMRGTWLPARSNRAVADFWDQDGVPYSSKTLLLDPCKSRPRWQDWLGHEVSLPISKIRPTGALPRGKTIFTASPRAIGQRVCEAYNASLERYGVERLAVTLRLRVEDEAQWRYYYWEEDLHPLDYRDYSWADSSDGGDGWSRGIRAVKRGEDKSKAADIRWTTDGQMWMRHQVPMDADIFYLPDSHILDRQEGNQALSEGIDKKIRCA